LSEKDSKFQWACSNLKEEKMKEIHRKVAEDYIHELLEVDNTEIRRLESHERTSEYLLSNAASTCVFHVEQSIVAPQFQ
jgi:hypothetical protein